MFKYFKKYFLKKNLLLKENIILLFLKVCVKRFSNPASLSDISTAGYWDIQHLFWKLLVERCINNLDKVQSALNFQPPVTITHMY